MIDIGRLVDIFSGEEATAGSPAIRGVAEGDSHDGEVEVYLGELEQVYETEMAPLYETDEDGEIVYGIDEETGEEVPVPLLDELGNEMYAEQIVRDEDGNPVPVLDGLGNAVYAKVQLLDADGDPIVEYDAEGNPVAMTDDHGDPIYLLDEDGQRLPEIDDSGAIVYQRDPETGDYILDGEGNKVPVYQVQAVEEAQTATLEAIGSVSEGETPVVSMGHGSAAVLAGAGWGDSIRRITGDLSTLIREYGDGVLVCREGNAIGALVNADGSFDVVAVEWDEDGVPTAGTVMNRVTSYGMSIYDDRGFMLANFGSSSIFLGGGGGQYITIDRKGLSRYNSDGTPADSVNSDETWTELNIAPLDAGSFYVPAGAITSLELSIAGNFVPDPDYMYEPRDRYGYFDHGNQAVNNTFIAPGRLFKMAPRAIRITGRDSERNEETVEIAVPAINSDVGTSWDDTGMGLLRASYERDGDGQSRLYDELVLSRDDGAYVIRRFGIEVLGIYEQFGDGWISDERTLMVADGYELPGLIIPWWDIQKEGAWNNGLVPAWYSDPVDKGYAVLSVFAHPLELNYYRCTIADYPTTRLLAINPFYDPTCQTNRASFAGKTGEEIVRDIFAELYEGAYAGGSYFAPVFYALATPQVENVSGSWKWPTLPALPLNSNGYRVELVYSEPTFHDAWDYWDRYEHERAVKVRWKAGTLDARLAEKVDIDDLADVAVTGVKGAAEADYRKGNVEIDEEDIGLGRLTETDIDAIIALAG